MDGKVKDMRNIPVYPYPGAYARYSGEIDQYRESRQANMECRRAIDAVFDAAWDGFRLPAEAGQALLERFGPERMAYVLADTVQQRRHDRRFSLENHAWAQRYPMFVSLENRWDSNLKCHSAKLDGLITQLRPELEQDPALNTRAEALRAIPLYPNSMPYATAHNEIAQCAVSHEANIACKEAIERAIELNHFNDVLSSDGAKQVVDQYGVERVSCVLAATIRQMEWDGRISADNSRWAAEQPSYDTADTAAHDRKLDYIVHSHPGLTDLFLRQVRAYTQEQNRTAEQGQSVPTAVDPQNRPEKNTGRSGMVSPETSRNPSGRAESSVQEPPQDRQDSGRPSIRRQLAEKPPARETPMPSHRKPEASL